MNDDDLIFTIELEITNRTRRNGAFAVGFMVVQIAADTDADAVCDAVCFATCLSPKDHMVTRATIKEVVA